VRMTKAKAVVAIIGALVTATTVALSDNVFDISDTTQLVVVLIEQAAIAYAVFAVPNKPVDAPTTRAARY
jgi:hypothetical protein